MTAFIPLNCWPNMSHMDMMKGARLPCLNKSEIPAEPARALSSRPFTICSNSSSTLSVPRSHSRASRASLYFFWVRWYTGVSGTKTRQPIQTRHMMRQEIVVHLQLPQIPTTITSSTPMVTISWTQLPRNPLLEGVAVSATYVGQMMEVTPVQTPVQNLPT